MRSLSLPNSARVDLERIVRAGYPLETCGLLMGRESNGHVKVERVLQARNLNRERAHDRYELDPQDFISADERARAAGLDIVGVWHSHPDHPACPSETDRACAWEDWSYVILSVTRDGVRDVRSWRLSRDQFVEESVKICPR